MVLQLTQDLSQLTLKEVFVKKMENDLATIVEMM